MKKKIVALIFVCLAAFASTACWFRKSNYNDYIASINNLERHTSRLEIVQNNVAKIHQIRYNIQNQMVVDFPVTVTMKLVSENPIIMDDELANGEDLPKSRRSKILARLEYRVLPHGKWVKISEYQIETGRLPESYPPAPYLGRNNIAPKGVKAGDKIMVRLYVTDGQWQSGNPSSLCDAKATNSVQYTYRYEYPQYDYTVKNVVEDHVGESNLGGGWLPHYVVVLEYSGKMRPIE